MVRLGMKKIAVLLFLALAGFNNAFAADTAVAASPTLPKDLSELEGMYWHNFKNGYYENLKTEEYEATDVLELVPYDKDSMYFRASLSFFNFHSCGISGIAERDEGRLTYYDTTYGNGCVLHIVPTSSSITLNDPTGQCRMMSCGARGGYGSEQFTPRRKKKITYMGKLLDSPQYKDAVVNYERLKAAKAQGIESKWANAKAMLGTYAFWGNVEGVKQALAQGADLDFKKPGWGPVSGAAYSRNIEITQMLLDYGLDINKLENGNTLLTQAVRYDAGQPSGDKQFTYVKWLLEKGADPNLANDEGLKPLDIALKYEADKRVVELLKQKGND